MRVNSTLENCVDSANTGLDAIKRAPIVDKDTGIRCLRIQDISQEKPFLEWGFTEVTEGNFKKFQLKKNDILIARTGGSIGVNRFIAEDCLAVYNNGLIRIRVDQNKYDPKFVYYLLRTESFKQHINAIAFSTAAQPNMKIADFLRFEFLDLPLNLQQEISKILSDIDGKILLNTQTNQTLESIAQAIFKSWFVDFEPVKAKMAVLADGGTREQAELATMGTISGKSEAELAQLQQQNPEHYQQLAETAALFPSAMVESELGEIPEGWEVSEIGNEVDIVGGGTPSTTEPSFWENGEIHWTTPKDLSNNKSKVLLNTERKITEAGLAKISSGLLPVNTVLMSSRAPVGYLALAKVPVAVNQGYIAMKCNSILSPEFIILWAESVMDEIQQRASGTTFAEISKKTFRSIPLIKPNSGAITKFTEKTHLIFNQIASNESQTESLIQIRDSLLPRLLSGDIVLDTE